MVVVGIISEYNPFHNGHLYQIETIRSRFGPDCAVIAIMSGNFVQRGEAAVLDKWSRARAALLCGVNLVIELPAAYATGSAERFADGGAALAAACGICDYLVFGSESGDLEELEAVAGILAFEPAPYQQALRSYLDLGLSYAVSRVKALGDFAPAVHADVVLSSSNNILAVEYLKALKRRNITALKPLTLRREGQGYKDTGMNPVALEDLPEIGSNPDSIGGSPAPGSSARSESGFSFPSASAIRAYAETLVSGGVSLSPVVSLLQTLSGAMPVPSLAIFADHFHKGTCVASQEVFADAVFTRLSSLSAADMARIPGMQEGLGARLKDLARRNPSGGSSLRNLNGSTLLHNPDNQIPQQDSGEESPLLKGRKPILGDNGVLSREWKPLSILIDSAATKRYPRTRVRRALLHMLLGLENGDLALFDNENGPFYLRILGFDKKGRYLLKMMRTKATLPILMKGSDFLEFADRPENKALRRMSELDCLATDLWMFKISGSAGQDFTTPPIAFLRSPTRSAR